MWLKLDAAHPEIFKIMLKIVHKYAFCQLIDVYCTVKTQFSAVCTDMI